MLHACMRAPPAPTCDLLVGFIVKFHWSSPLLPAFCHIMALMARSASTSVSWNQRAPYQAGI